MAIRVNISTGILELGQDHLLCVCLPHRPFDLVFNKTQINTPKVHAPELVRLSPRQVSLPLPPAPLVLCLPLAVIPGAPLLLRPKSDQAPRVTIVGISRAQVPRAELEDDAVILIAGRRREARERLRGGLAGGRVGRMSDSFESAVG